MLPVLVPVDHSDHALEALRYAHQLAGDAEPRLALKVLHVWLDTGALEFPGADIIQKRKAIEKQKLEEKIKERLGMELEVEVAIGFPKKEIVKASGEAWAVCMPPVGDRGIIGKVFGSVALGTALSAKAPVFIIPPGHAYRPIRTIVLAVAGLSIPAEVFDKLGWFQERYRPVIHVIHVISEEEGKNPVSLRPVEQAFEASGIPSGAFRFAQIVGEPVHESLLNYTSSIRADLLAVVHQSRGTDIAWMPFSTTGKLLYDDAFPLLVFHGN